MSVNLLNCLTLLSIAGIVYGDIPPGYAEVKNSHDFTGKVVLCTGSSSGIGKEVTKLFAFLGANVVVTGSNKDKVEKAAKEVEQVSGKKPLQVVTDLTKTESAKHLLDETIKAFGKLDVLINNAGIHKGANIRDSNFMDIFDKTWQLDVRALAQLTHLAVPHLEKTKGTIISTSSRNSLKPSRDKTAYNSAKAAIIMMTQVWAVELGPAGIRVNAVSPGNILDVDVFGDKTNDIMNNSDMPKQTPLGHRNGRPLEVATGYVFLASSDAKFITGHNLVIDGGFHLDSGAV